MTHLLNEPEKAQKPIHLGGKLYLLPKDELGKPIGTLPQQLAIQNSDGWNGSDWDYFKVHFPKDAPPPTNSDPT